MGAMMAKHSSAAGRRAMLGAVLTYGCLAQFPPLITQAQFHDEPSAWTLDVIGYAREYELAIETAQDIVAHLQLLCWDTLFAWIKGLTVYSILCVLTTEYTTMSTSSNSSNNNRRSMTVTTTPGTPRPWFAYTIPIHVALDTLENSVTILAIVLHQYYQHEHNTKLVPSATITTLLMLLPGVTMLKWCGAVINTGSVPLLTVSRLLHWCHATYTNNNRQKPE